MNYKILYITNGISSPGGLERVLSIKASYFADIFKYNVNILTLNQSGEQTFYSFSENIKYHNIDVDIDSVKYFFQYCKGLRKKVKEIKPDIIIVCDDGIKGFLVPYIIGRPCPLIYEKHSSKKILKNQDKPKFIQKVKLSVLDKIMNITGNKYDEFVVLTNDNLSEWKSLNNLQVIPNPLPFYPEQPSKLTNRKVITVGNHGFQKGFDRLLKSWKMVVERHPDWKLEIYGKFDIEKRHVKLAEKLNLGDTVSFFPPVRNIHEKYKEASVYAMSSRSEGFGMVLIEAMAYGVPCVAFDCPCGPKDIISNEKDGYLVKNGDLKLFADKLITLIDNQDLRQEMGKNGREKAKNYLPEAIADQWNNMFKRLIGHE